MAECPYCRWPLSASQMWFNGCWCHPRCAAHHERLILGEDAGPGLDEHLADAMRLARTQRFFARLADEAEALGIDLGTLSRAINAALCDRPASAAYRRVTA